MVNKFSFGLSLISYYLVSLINVIFHSQSSQADLYISHESYSKCLFLKYYFNKIDNNH